MMESVINVQRKTSGGTSQLTIITSSDKLIDVRSDARGANVFLVLVYWADYY